MKAFLMHRDRDFDPSQLLIRRERELRYNRGADQSLSLQPALPWNEEALRQDLGLDVLFKAMSAGDKFLFEVAQVAMLSSLTDLGAIRYRQHILADSLKNAPIVRDIYQIAMDAIEGERKNYWSAFGRYPTGTLHRAVDVLQMFVAALKRLRTIADRHAISFESQGYSRTVRHAEGGTRATIISPRSSEHLHRLNFRHGTLISAQLGKGNKGTNYVLRKPNDDHAKLADAADCGKAAELFVSASSPRRSRRAGAVGAQRPRRQSRRQCAGAIHRPYPQLFSDAAHGIGVLRRLPQFA